MAFDGSSDTSEIQTRLLGIAESVRERLALVVADLTADLASRAEGKIPGLFQTRTGTLASSVRQVLYDNFYGVTGIVKSTDPVAHIWEGGWGGKTVDVRGFTRRVKTMRAVYSPKHGGAVWRMRHGGVIAEVRPFTRNIPRQAARSFLRSTLEEMRSTIRSQIEAALNGA